MNINEYADNCYLVSLKRKRNGAKLDNDLLKHAATELMEAMEANRKADKATIRIALHKTIKSLRIPNTQRLEPQTEATK